MMAPATLATRSIKCCAMVAACAAGLPSLYLALLTAIASGPPQAIQAQLTPRRRNRFAVCVPAHNEQANIAKTVEALLAQDYPATSFSVHVVADNCTDLTAAKASASGANVLVRTDPELRGKGEALNWLIARVAGDDVDAVAIVDADTIADRGFLAGLDRAFARGGQVVQGFYAVKDPETSTTVGLRYAAIACRHHLRPLARTRLGGSSGLYGNGMAFRKDVLVGRRWSNHLIEDAEFQMELLLDGHLVVYAPDAVVRAEMPVSLEGATSQNERWELGRLQLLRRYVPLLARRTVRGGALPRRTYVDAVSDHLTPPLSLLALIDSAAVGIGSLPSSGPSRSPRRRSPPEWRASLVLGLHVLVGLRLVQAPPSVYRSLRSAPRAVLWKLLLLARIARRPTDVTWTRTERNPPVRDRS